MRRETRNVPDVIPVTVTFLEMTAPPANYAHPPMNRQSRC